jgi:RNA polymerase sigma-70 factor (ECF subfamily)
MTKRKPSPELGIVVRFVFVSSSIDVLRYMKYRAESRHEGLCDTMDALPPIAALRQQDSAAFEQLYLVFAPHLRRYLLRLCGDRDIVDDLLQETFRKAYCALPRIDSDIALRPWLYTIATNTARSVARTAHWRRVYSFDDSALDDQTSSGSAIEAQMLTADLVERALAALKPDHALALMLHWQEDFSIDELCHILDLARDTVKKRLYRAKKAFSTAYVCECMDEQERKIP